MYISHVTIPFEKLAEALGLPPTVKIVGVKEHAEGVHMVVRVVADTMPSDCLLAPDDPLTKIGTAYLPKEEVVGAKVGGSAVVEGISEPESTYVVDAAENAPLGEVVSPTVVS